MRNHIWGHLFHSVTEFWIHQNELMWSRMKVLLVIEGFILTSAYTIEGKIKVSNYFTLALFITGFFITSAIFIIASRDLKYRKMFYDMLVDITRRAKSHYVFKIDVNGKITGTIILKTLCIFLSSINLILAFLCIISINKSITILQLLSGG